MIIGRDDWGARERAYDPIQMDFDDKKVMEGHHTVGLYGTQNGRDLMREIQADHLSRGWADIFYHFVIWPDSGNIYRGRQLIFQGGSLKGTITVAFAGNYENNGLSASAMDAWKQLEEMLGPKKISWHRQRSSTLCPGEYAIRFLRLRKETMQEMKETTMKVVGFGTIVVGFGKDMALAEAIAEYLPEAVATNKEAVVESLAEENWTLVTVGGAASRRFASLSDYQVTGPGRWDTLRAVRNVPWEAL